MSKPVITDLNAYYGYRNDEQPPTEPRAGESVRVPVRRSSVAALVRVYKAAKALQPLGEAYLEGSPWAPEFDELEAALTAAEKEGQQ